MINTPYGMPSDLKQTPMSDVQTLIKQKNKQQIYKIHLKLTYLLLSTSISLYQSKSGYIFLLSKFSIDYNPTNYIMIYTPYGLKQTAKCQMIRLKTNNKYKIHITITILNHLLSTSFWVHQSDYNLYRPFYDTNYQSQ